MKKTRHEALKKLIGDTKKPRTAEEWFEATSKYEDDLDIALNYNDGWDIWVFKEDSLDFFCVVVDVFRNEEPFSKQSI